MKTLLIPVLAMLLAPLGADTAKPQPAPSRQPAAARPRTRKPRPARKGLLELNSATKAQLKTLPGITDELAERIIAHRPYYSKAGLTAGVLPQGMYFALKDRVMCAPPPLPPKK